MSVSQEPNGELRKHSRLQTYLSMGLLFIPLCGFVWNQSIELRSTSDAVKDLNLKISQVEQFSHSYQKQSEDNKNTISSLRERFVSVEENLKEIETQFDAIEQASNSRRDETFRWLSIVWNKHPDLGPFPTAPYFHSNISNRK